MICHIRTSPSARRSEAGFTLTEMMIVVVILSILSTLAIVYLKPKTKPLDVSNRVADLVREGSREAVSYGMVRAQVAAVNGKQRTRITGAGAVNSSPTFTLQRFVENSAPATTGTWVTMQTYQTPAKVIGVAFATSVGAYASVTLLTDWNTFVVNCYPNGTCDGATLFFQAATGNTGNLDFRSRVSVLPLGTATLIRNDWL
jgi:prepilin-type N-terminal cleavage/methylation domain-containing protein